MSLADFTAPLRHAADDRPGPLAALLRALIRTDRSEAAAERPGAARDGAHAARERGYLNDIGI